MTLSRLGWGVREGGLEVEDGAKEGMNERDKGSGGMTRVGCMLERKNH